MFTGVVVWRGIAFTLFTLVGKLMTAICLFRIAVPSSTMASMIKDVCKPRKNTQMELLEFGKINNILQIRDNDESRWFRIEIYN